MLQRERVAENVYSFQSDVYAQVNAGAIVGPNWAIVIDTLALPEETLEIRQFIEQELQIPVRYVINTHYHADHTWGNYLFPNATILSSTLCRELIDTKGRASLEEAKKQGTTFRQGRIVLPHLTFSEGSMNLRIGKKTLSMVSFPGHSPDNIGVIVEEDRVLFAGDIFMPIPYIVDGDVEEMTQSLKEIGKMGFENVVQGHGDIVLRGEVEISIKDNIAYLSAIRRAVRKAARRKYPWDLLEDIGVEECGKSRVLIGGLAEDLHSRNLFALYEQLYGEPPASSDDED
ncbi:MAG: MBL fold metallo-hydrolase [Anaerolineales bacterium]|nr:MBL fold metallo-hydrolase [Anaerolineales bacterium]